MNLDELKKTLIDNKLFVDDKSKNFIAICPYCGDHPNPRKRGHLYISKNDSIPVVHCFYCNKSVPIPQFIIDVTGNKERVKDIIDVSKIQKEANYSVSKDKIKKYKLPILNTELFPFKSAYIRNRTGNKIELEKIPNLIFNFDEFFRYNYLNIVGEGKTLSNFEFDLLQNQFVGFLSKNHSTVYCRSVDDAAIYKFKKIPLQESPFLLLDYWEITNNENSGDTVMLTEGIFNALGEYVSDSLQMKNRVITYASGNSFSYPSLLKSVCFDHSLFNTNVVILSDNDKTTHSYNKFLQESDHVIKTYKAYINKNGKDFGVFPQRPAELL